MKVLILANNDIGLYNFRKELLEKLLELKYDVYISLPNGNKVKDLIKLGCNFIETDVDRRGTNPIKDLKLYFKYKKIIKKINPNVILTYTIKPNIYGGIAASKLRIPYLPNITGLGSMFQKKGFLKKILIYLYKIAMKKSNVVFVQNEDNLKVLVDIGIANSSKCILLPGSGVNIKQFCLEKYPEDSVLKFLFIGRIMNEKGIVEYLETARIIKEKYNNTEFHIAGEFEEKSFKEKINQFVKEDIVIYDGIVPNSKELIKKCHCTILPSYHEGKSNVLLESAATGRPIITTNIPGCQEIVEDNKTGFVVNLKDTEDLIKKVEKFINLTDEQRKEMGEMR